MNKKVISALLLCAAMVATLAVQAPVSSGSSDKAGGQRQKIALVGKMTYAMVTHSSGNPYNAREASGFKEISRS